MRILLRILTFSVILGLSAAVLAQSNNSSGSNPPSLGPDAIQSTQNTNGGTSYSLKDAAATQAGAQQVPLTQDEVNSINQTITLLENKLQQINDPNDPRAIKLQATIDKYQDLLNQ